MKQKIKKVMIFIFIVIMVPRFCTVVSASDGNTANTTGTEENKNTAIAGGGTGVVRIEGTVNTDIYQVILPTNVKGTFDFILDPQSLINKTNAAAYNGQKFEANSTVFFRRTDGQVKDDYSHESDFVTIVNKSSMPVDVSLNIKISKEFSDKISLTSDKQFNNDTTASLYLALKDKEKEVPIGKDGLSLNVTIAAAPDGAYEFSFDKKNAKYIYKLKDNLSGIEFDKYSFQLTGIANHNGDWTKISKSSPGIEVTWKISPQKGKTIRKDAILDYNTIPNETGTPEAGTEPAATSVTQTKATAPADAETPPSTAPPVAANTDENTNTENIEPPMNKLPSAAVSSYTVSGGTPLSINVDLGAGDTAAKKVISVHWKDSNDELLGVSDSVRYKDGQILFSANWVDACIADTSRLPSTLIVQFDDASLTQAEILLNR